MRPVSERRPPCHGGEPPITRMRPRIIKRTMVTETFEDDDLADFDDRADADDEVQDRSGAVRSRVSASVKPDRERFRS